MTLLALALGYYLGGYAADRTGRLGVIYGAIVLAALYLLVPALLREPLAFWSLRFDLAWASLLTAGLLFFVPLFLLAAVGPFLIRFLAASLESIGSQVGRLTALSTLGGLCGTLLVSYLMIPFLPHTLSLCLTAGLLLSLGAGCLALQRRPWPAGFSVLGITAALCALWLLQGRGPGTSFKAAREIHRQNTHYGLLQVLESRTGSWRVLLNDYLVQNQYQIREGRSMSVPTYMLYHLCRGYTPELKRVLCIGLGAGGSLQTITIRCPSSTPGAKKPCAATSPVK